MNEAIRILNEVKKAVVGKDDVLARALLALLARGHILLEDIPGVGKTTMALAFSRALSLDNKATGQMEYQSGAALCNLFLADELNRATSRTQSALLEAMEEGQVTVDGVSHPVPRPFLVIATQNPAGASGTQPLPDEKDLLRRKQGGNPLERVGQVLDHGGLLALQDRVEAVHVSDEVLEYIVALIGATRRHPMIEQGASPRASLAVTAMAKAAAFVQDRDYVLPEDVRLVFPDTVAHRLLLSPKAEAGKLPPVQAVLRAVPAPKVR